MERKISGVPAVFQGHVFLPQPFFGMPISGAPMGPPTYAGMVPNIGYPTLTTEDYARMLTPKDVADSYPLLPLTKAKQICQIAQPTPPPPPSAKSKQPKHSSTNKFHSAAAAGADKAPPPSVIVSNVTATNWARLPAGKEPITVPSPDSTTTTPITTSATARPKSRPSVESAISRLINKSKQQQQPPPQLEVSPTSSSATSSDLTPATSLSSGSPADSSSLKRKQPTPRKRGGGVPLLTPAFAGGSTTTTPEPAAISPLPKCEQLEPLEKMPKLELQTRIENKDVKRVSPGKKRTKPPRIVSNWKPVGVGTKRFVYMNVSSALYVIDDNALYRGQCARVRTCVGRGCSACSSC